MSLYRICANLFCAIAVCAIPLFRNVPLINYIFSLKWKSASYSPCVLGLTFFSRLFISSWWWLKILLSWFLFSRLTVSIQFWLLFSFKLTIVLIKMWIHKYKIMILGLGLNFFAKCFFFGNFAICANNFSQFWFEQIAQLIFRNFDFSENCANNFAQMWNNAEDCAKVVPFHAQMMRKSSQTYFVAWNCANFAHKNAIPRKP